MKAWLLVLLAYLLGSIPTGFVVGSLSGIDIRRAGSGNVGATNVARVVGKAQGLLTLLGDVAKGFIPAYLAYRLGLTQAMTAVVAFAAFFGHLYPVFLKFRGGKGVATALGAFLALAPMATVVLIVIFSCVAAAGRIVSLASLVAALCAPLAFWFFAYPPALVWLSLLIGLWITARHWENVRRLLAGTEPRFHL